MKISRTGLLALLQLVLAGATLEILGRAIDPLGISYYPESARFFDRLIIGEPLGYRLPPGMSEEFWGVSVETNSIGLRDREVATPKPASERRVMMLGDSGVFSLGVEYEDSIPARLEGILNQSAPEGVHYRTLNMGVPSYNTEQELVQLEEVGLPLEPDVVILYFATNDIEPKMWVFEKRRNPLVDLAQRSYAASISYILFRRVSSLVFGLEPALIQYSSFAPDHPRWIAIEKSLTKMSRLLRDRSIPFIVFTAGEDSDPHLSLLRAVGDSEGFPVVRLSVLSKGSEWAANPAKFVNSAIDNHCNPVGCKLVAAEMARLISEAGIR